MFSEFKKLSFLWVLRERALRSWHKLEKFSYCLAYGSSKMMHFKDKRSNIRTVILVLFLNVSSLSECSTI